MCLEICAVAESYGFVGGVITCLDVPIAVREADGTWVMASDVPAYLEEPVQGALGSTTPFMPARELIQAILTHVRWVAGVPEWIEHETSLEADLPPW